MRYFTVIFFPLVLNHFRQYLLSQKVYKKIFVLCTFFKKPFLMWLFWLGTFERCQFLTWPCSVIL